MRFASLALQKFGHFPSLDLAMPAEHGLHVLYGPNEAGKTTLLDALRGALYGIEKSAYHFQFGPDAMELRATLHDRDGRAIALSRKRAKRARLVAERSDGDRNEPLADDELAKYFGAVSRAQFETVFGFTRHDLERGAELFKTAGFAEILAGSALGGGGARVRELRAALEREAGALFSPRARNPKVNDALGRLADLEKARDAALLKGGELRDLLASIEAEGARADAFDGDVAALEAKRARAARLRSALEDFRELTALDERLASPAFASPLGAAEARALLAAMNDVEAEQKKARELEREEEALRARHAAYDVDDKLLSEADRVRVLVKQVDKVAEARARRPRADAEIESLRRALDADLTRKLDGMTEAALLAWKPRPSARDAVLSAAEAIERLEQEIATAGAERGASAAALADAERDRLEAGGDAPARDLTAQSDALEKLQRTFAELETQQLDAAKQRADVARIVAQLAPSPAREPPLDSLPLPARDAVQEQKKELEKLRKKSEHADEKRRELEERVADLGAQRAALMTSGALPTMADLSAARARRDHGWSLVKRSLAGDAPAAKDARAFDEGPLPEAFERAMLTADAIADRIREDAQRVAQLTQIAIELETKEAALARARRDCGSAAAASDAWRSEWQALWQPSGIDPRDPVDMLEWLSKAEEARAQLAHLRRIEAAIAHNAAILDAFAAQRRAKLGDPESADASVGELLQMLRHRIEAERARTVRRDEANRQIEKNTGALAAADEKLRVLRAKLAEATDALAAALPEVGLPSTLAAKAARERLAALDPMVERARALDAKRREREGDRAALAHFDGEVDGLLAALRTSRDARTPEQAVAWLEERLREAARQNDARARDEEVISALAARRQAALAEASRYAEAVARAKPDVAIDDPSLRALCETAIARDALAAKRAEVDVRLARLLGSGESRAEDERVIASAQPDALESEERALATSIDAARREAGAARERLGALRERVDRLGGDAAARAQADFERERARLLEEADRFCAVEVARSVLDRVVERFTREHQPALLTRASQLFETITGGRYARIERELGEDDVAVVLRNGDRKRPNELSTGTREQLFLALRLAYVVQYCATAEPLPIIADDVLVSFDAARTERALFALGEVAKTTQVLLLTCHEHVVERARASKVDAHVIELPAPV